MTDLLLIETGSGGDLVLRGNDLASVKGYENAPYLAMFGGGDWWGNYMLPEANRFRAQTESVLKRTPLTSAGRQRIEQAILADLDFLKGVPGTTVSVSTMIANTNRLDISITINGKRFDLQWNPDELFLTYKV